MDYCAFRSQFPPSKNKLWICSALQVVPVMKWDISPLLERSEEQEKKGERAQGEGQKKGKEKEENSKRHKSKL